MNGVSSICLFRFQKKKEFVFLFVFLGLLPQIGDTLIFLLKPNDIMKKKMKVYIYIQLLSKFVNPTTSSRQFDDY